jgi:glycerophosphoryl diester phosphodiesterase
MPVITFAHRGARLEEPENTIPAFRRALEQGVSGLETDAWLAADGEVVLAHDAVVRRGMRRRKVHDATAAQLAEFGVPRLADLYKELGADYDLSIDLKERGVAEPLIEVARAYGDPGRAWLCTPSVAHLRDLRVNTDVKLVHSQRRRQIEAALERHAADLAAIGVDAMNMHHTEWSGGLVSLFHRFGILAFAWDAQEERQLRAVLQMGIDGVYCDNPSRMVSVVGEWTTS